MLTDAAKARSHEIMLEQDHTLVQGSKETTAVHEAYQYLIQKFVETEEGLEAGLAISLDDLNKRRRRSSVNSVKNYEIRRGSIQSWNGSDDSARQSRYFVSFFLPFQKRFFLSYEKQNGKISSILKYEKNFIFEI